MTFDGESRPKLARKARLRWDRRGERHVLLYPERGLSLNEVAAAIVEMCDGSRSLDDIVSALENRWKGVPRATLEADTRAFLDRLAQRGLLERGERSR